MNTIKITINDISDLNNFYRRLRKYKLFNNNSLLKLKSINNLNDEDIYQLKSVIKVFNIKNKDKRLDCIIDEACNYIDKFFVNKNTCEFKDNYCGYQRNKCAIGINGCCRECMYLENGRCHNDNTACKLFYCPYIRHKKRCPTLNDIKVLEYFLSIKKKIIIQSCIYQTKEETIKSLNQKSLFLWCFKRRKNNHKSE